MVKLTRRSWRDLVRVNREVNDQIEPASDLETFGVLDFWEPEQPRDDCDGYALTKRQRLIDLGYDWRDLRLTCVTASGMGHLVLTVATDQGDYVMDNLRQEIMPWHHTGYTPIQIQDHNSATGWVKCVS
jgi:predicted transglutaminase-like cysteine proteinase